MMSISSIRNGLDISIEDTEACISRIRIYLNTLLFEDKDLKREIIRRISRVTKTAALGKKQDRNKVEHNDDSSTAGRFVSALGA